MNIILGLGVIFSIMLILAIYIVNVNGQLEFNLENNLNVGDINKQPQPALLNSAIYKSYGSQSHIFGEVLNNFSYPISFVKVYAAVQSASGDVIVTSDGFVRDNYLKPGQKSGFWILVDEDVPAKSNFTLVSTFDKPARIKPESLKLDVTLMSLNPIKVVGTVTNLGEEPATFVDVTGIFYDENHIVVDSEEEYVIIYGELEPREMATFELEPIMNYENRDRIKSVALNVESTEYIMMANNLTKTIVN